MSTLNLGHFRVVNGDLDTTEQVFGRLVDQPLPDPAERDLNLLRRVAGIPAARMHRMYPPAANNLRAVKGDVEGHPFHGNQYTAGGSGQAEVYHATSAQVVDKIITEGFKTSKGGMYGTGVYFADTKEACSRYGDQVLSVTLKNSDVKPYTEQEWSDLAFGPKITALAHQIEEEVGESEMQFGMKYVDEAFNRYIKEQGFKAYAIKRPNGQTYLVVPDPKDVGEISRVQKKSNGTKTWYYVQFARKGDAEGHPFRGNQYTEGFVEASHIEGFDSKRYAKDFPEALISANNVFTSWLGKDFTDVKQVEVVHRSDGSLTMAVRESKIHDVTVKYYERNINFRTGVVKHEYLWLKEGESGGGMVKTLFADSIDMYDRMELKEVKTHAALELGAYTWAKYGFEYRDDAERVRHHSWLSNSIDRLVPDPAKLAKEDPMAAIDFEGVRHALAEGDHLRMNQVLSDLDTPDLDAWLRKQPKEHFEEWFKHVDDARGGDGAVWEQIKTGGWPAYLDRDRSGFIKHMFYGTDYEARLPLAKDTPSRKRTDAHLAKKHKPK